MILVYDNTSYIRVRSKRDLSHENSTSPQRINVAGQGVAMPGSTTGTHVFANPLGVLPPGSFYSTDLPNGEGMKGSPTRNWTPSAGAGQGSVGGPVLHARQGYDDRDPLPSFYFDHFLAAQFATISNRHRSSPPGTGINHVMPHDVYASGTLYGGGSPLSQPGAGSVGRDVNSTARLRYHKLHPKRERGF